MIVVVGIAAIVQLVAGVTRASDASSPLYASMQGWTAWTARCCVSTRRRRPACRPTPRCATRSCARELEPGRQLSENELAALLGVSRTPIREALVRLRDERLVEIVPQLGTFVTRIATPAVADAQFIREALECAAIRRAAELATEDDIAALEDNLRAPGARPRRRRLRRLLHARRRAPPARSATSSGHRAAGP